MANSVGSVSIDLEARIAKFESDLGRAARIADQRAQQMRRTLGAVAGALGATISIVGITSWIKSAVDAQDAMSKLGQKVAVSTEKLSGYQLAAKQAGVDNESLQKGLVKLGQAAAAASEGSKQQANAFKSIGLSVTDANGHLKNSGVLFEQVADKLSKYKDSTEKTVIATRLFGKAGADLIPLLNGGKEGLAEYAKMAEDFGLIVGSKSAKAAEDFNDRLEQLSFVSKGVANQIATALAPALADLAQKAVAFFRGDSWKKTLDDISTGAKYVADHIGDIINATKLLGEIVVTVYASKMIASGIAWIGNLTAQGVAVDALGAKTALSLGASIKQYGILQSVATAAGVALIGWQIGTYLYNQFQIVRDAAAVMIGAVLVGWEKIKSGAQLAFIGLSDTWTEIIGRMEQRFYSFQSGIAKVLQNSILPGMKDAGQKLAASVGEAASVAANATEAKLTKNAVDRMKIVETTEKKIAAIRANVWSGVGIANNNGANDKSLDWMKAKKPDAPDITMAGSAAKDAADKLKAAYDAMVQSLQSKIAVDRESLQVGAQISQAEKDRAQLVQAMDSGTLKVTASQRAYLLSLADTHVELQKTIELEKQRADGLAKLDALTQSLTASLQNQKDANAINLIGISHGSEVAKQLQGELQIRQQFQRQMDDLNKEASKPRNVGTVNGIGGEMYNKQLAALQDYLGQTLDLYRQNVDDVKAYQMDGMNGVRSAMEDFMTRQQDMAAQMKEFTSNAMSGFSDAFADFVSGSKSAKEAFGSLIDDMYRQALKMLANKAIQALFDSFGATSNPTAGSSAGGWGSIFSNLLNAYAGSGGGGFGPGTIGAGLAVGGMAYAGSVHPVNENGPEIFTVNDRDYLAAGNANVKVTPITEARSYGGNTNVTNVYVQPTSTRRTADQVAQAVDRKQRIASARNG